MPNLVEVKEHSLSLQYSAAGGLVRNSSRDVMVSR